MRIFLPTPGATLKYWVSCLFDFDVGDRLLRAWLGFWVPKAASIWGMRLAMETGLALVKAHSAYGALWLIHYLNRREDWATANRLMTDNGLCPLGVRKLYRELIAADEKDAKEAIEVLAFPRAVRRALDRYKEV